ncbi:MAG: Ig-like domain-containing protein [Actinobacteria bacterium]|nr:Ig-like domain-containing protein [Actinomycetota bacterium]
MRLRCGVVRGAAVVALAALALCAGVVALAGDRPARAAQTRAGAPSLSAGVSTHAPCGNPMWLRARLKDGSGQGVKGVKVTFSFKLKSGAVHRQATTDAQGAARVQITPTPDMSPDGVKVIVKAKAVYRGVTLAAATWFTPKYT